MSKRYAELTFTPAVQAQQQKYGSRAQYARMQAQAGPDDLLGQPESQLLAEADSFYLATVSESGWPYVQHRGGPRGFLKLLSPARLAFADFRGNRQYISAGNVAGDDRASMIVMDYANHRRLKLAGRLRFVDPAEAEPKLLDAVRSGDYPARTERIGVFEVAAFDWNCPQHITPRFTVDEIEETVQSLRVRIAELEAEVRTLRAGTPSGS
jgi:hypothetical protein